MLRIRDSCVLSVISTQEVYVVGFFIVNLSTILMKVLETSMPRNDFKYLKCWQLTKNLTG